MKKNIVLILSLIIMVFALSACSSTGNSPKDSSKAEKESSEGVEKAEVPELTEAEKLEALKLEREEVEKARKEELAEFYVPLPPLGEDKDLPTVKAKALYITGNVAGFKFQEEDIDYYADYINAINGKSGLAPDSSRLDEINKLERALGIAKASEINSLVIDVKNDHGLVTWDSDLKIVEDVASNTNTPFSDYGPLFDYLDKNEIYKIARVVAFKDPLFASAKPESAIQLKAGGVYLDNAGEAWVNPFDEYVWKYVVSLSKEAALRGFGSESILWTKL